MRASWGAGATATVVAGALVVGAPQGATAAPAAPALRAAEGDKPVVLGGIRPGPRKLSCPRRDRVELVIDYFDGLKVTKTTPRSARRAVVKFLHPSPPQDFWSELRYERRAVPVPDYVDDPAEYRRHTALFVGLRPNGKILVQIPVGAVKHKGEFRWFILGAMSCRRS